MTDDQANKPITSRYVRDCFMWDRMGDVDWDLVRNNLASANRVLLNPDKFPKADFESIEKKAAELSAFLKFELVAA